MKILAVDDSFECIKFHRKLFNYLFADTDFELDFEMSARAGYNKVLGSADEPYNLIISDLEMENMEDEVYAGIWFVRNILQREECRDSRIIIVSGSYDIDRIAEGLGVYYIPKNELFKNPLLMKYKLEEIFN